MSSWSDLLAELGSVNANHADAFTTRELMAESKIGERVALDAIRRGLSLGVLKVTRKSITDMAGRPQTVPAYERIKPTKKGSK